MMPVSIPQRKGDPVIFDADEHPRAGTTVETLAKLKGINGLTKNGHSRKCIWRE